MHHIAFCPQFNTAPAVFCSLKRAARPLLAGRIQAL
jgi:hypothetical protein